MHELKAILWAIGMIFSIMFVFVMVGMSGLVNMFPEGRRWWMIYAQLASLVIFAIGVLCNPWTN